MFEDEHALKWIRKRTPAGRPGEEHELAGTLLFLASDAASYITGTVLDVDGGVNFTSPEQGRVDAIDFKNNPRVRKKS